MAKILVVEDYPSIQKVYLTVLNHEGYQVTVAGDGKEALEIVATDQPDLILLDLLMSNIGGLEFLHAYNLAEHPGTKVIVLSNLASPELEQEAKDLGANLYLTKSDYTPQQLVVIIKETLAKK